MNFGVGDDAHLVDDTPVDRKRSFGNRMRMDYRNMVDMGSLDFVDIVG